MQWVLMWMLITPNIIKKSENNVKLGLRTQKNKKKRTSKKRQKDKPLNKIWMIEKGKNKSKKNKNT